MDSRFGSVRLHLVDTWQRAPLAYTAAMSEQRKRDTSDQRPEREARKVMDDTLRRMLATPPEPHVEPKTKKRKKAAK
jgi:hypothetical protein